MPGEPEELVDGASEASKPTVARSGEEASPTAPGATTSVESDESSDETTIVTGGADDFDELHANAANPTAIKTPEKRRNAPIMLDGRTSNTSPCRDASSHIKLRRDVRRCTRQHLPPKRFHAVAPTGIEPVRRCSGNGF